MNMKLHPNFRIWIAFAVLVLAVLACGPNVVQPVPTQVPQAQPTLVPQNQGSTNNGPTTSTASLIKSTVQIYGLQIQNGNLTPIYSGSGTIISSTGLILTNAHVASPASQGDTSSEPDALAIGLMDQEDKPPVFLYFAKVRAVDGYLDLAVIQITTTLDGTDVNPSGLNLPFVPLGDSDQLHVGDNIKIFGFPGIGGETITFTTGNVSGFTSEKGLGDRAWIKTDATIAGGNSGGLAANNAGFLVGVPTSASAGTGGNVTDCRVIQDTNGDGVVDSRDTCIPIGGFINGLRPINLALPLIKAAQMGQAYVTPYGGPSQTTTSGSGSESFGAISWYTATGGSDCQVKDPVTGFPSGTTSMAAAFSFSGMTDGEPWAEKWTVDGQELYSSQYSWSSGEQGNTFTCLYNSQSGMPEGNYHIELYAGTDLSLMTQSDVVVGGESNGALPPTNQGVVTVSGRVLDADSKNSLPGAEIYVLNPGISFDKWTNDGFANADIFTYAKADNQGNYSLPDKLALNVGYTIVVYAEGYKITYGDDISWTSQDPLNYQMDLKLSK
jgi:S1-C subfamily serine protease